MLVISLVNSGILRCHHASKNLVLFSDLNILQSQTILRSRLRGEGDKIF